MIFELSKAVDSSDLDSIHKFNILKQQIIEGQKVDIRKQGNEANHEITLKNKEDAIGLINFIEMLLKFIYEFPSKMKAKKV